MVSSPKLVVYHPDTRLSERRYILDTVLHEFLGLEYESHTGALGNIAITLSEDPGNKCLVLEDVLLQVPDGDWLSQRALPPQPLRTWRVSADLPEAEARVVSPEIPIIYGNTSENRALYEQTDARISLGLDVFGSAFFMLTGYEEVVKRDRDRHDRFPAVASVAYQSGFLERPIIDEYVEVLWSCMERLWPGLKRKRREYRLALSHDVDQPLAVLNKSWVEVLRSAGGDLLKRRDLGLAWQRIVAQMGRRFGWYDVDPFNTFDFIMDVSENNGVSSTFFFIADHTGNHHIDGDYSIDMPWVRHLMRTIHSRGHEIGLHASYNSFRDGVQIQHEFDRLLDVAEHEGIEQDEWGSRQHYLRWETPVTWRILDQAGVTYDTTLCYADHIGFRCGVCHEFPVYDLEKRESLALRERPLIVMDRTLVGESYMGLSLEEASDAIITMSERVRTVNGDFTFLCHNNTLATKGARRVYAEVIRSCASPRS